LKLSARSDGGLKWLVEQYLLARIVAASAVAHKPAVSFQKPCECGSSPAGSVGLHGDILGVSDLMSPKMSP